MSEPFADVEQIIRGLADGINPAVSLRQRVLTASRIARERQLTRIRVRNASCGILTCLCMIFAGIQVQRNWFTSHSDPNDNEHLAANIRTLKGPQVLMGALSNDRVLKDAVLKEAVQSSKEQAEKESGPEAAAAVLNDPIEWETAEFHWKQRSRQSALISNYF